MKRLVILLALVACKDKESPPPQPAPTPAAPATPSAPPPMDRAALLAGKLPEGAAETDLINAQCRTCHAVEYLTQQRLTEAAWTKTIAKMKKFGANLSDADTAKLAKFAATYWNPDLPSRVPSKLVAPPAGAQPMPD